MTIPAVLDNRRIRRKRHDGEWWFAVEDVCGMLMDGTDGGACWRKLKRSLAKEGCDVGALCQGLELPASDGTGQQADCVTLEGVFRYCHNIQLDHAKSAS